MSNVHYIKSRVKYLITTKQSFIKRIPFPINENNTIPYKLKEYHSL